MAYIIQYYNKLVQEHAGGMQATTYNSSQLVY